MNTNAVVLIIVTAIAALVLVGMLVGVAVKTRSRKRGAAGGSIREEMKAAARETPRSVVTPHQHPSPDHLNE
jgi:type II secretory pathway pseudopilin PulG